jgi:hypothetical protein
METHSEQSDSFLSLSFVKSDSRSFNNHVLAEERDEMCWIENPRPALSTGATST